MDREDIILKLKEYISVKENRVVEKETPISNISFALMRDRLVGKGRILEENLNIPYYIIDVKSGFLNKNSAIVFIKWNIDKLEIYAYANEGLINQHTADEVVEYLVEKIINPV
ncbi:hypothetical protein ACVRXT_04560 [Streptococcus lutetiensis]|uniref:YokE-like PH domain-containing protein n=1 Tax=Streptococcus lutetiensis TaxID=150055 RepID=A0AB38G996_9STRE|nr:MULTISPECIES: hypothetical protein [Streptococcus]KEY47148.1 hypothetical protein EH70_05100 [Streptococcus equinus]QGX44422.1 hypothetical protein GO596_03620 [Streptococcus equinus]QQE30062.1 hypothetical protein I6H75_05810 [Streptococcus lutetiensis]SQF43167.1 Uncharacterised protein [Streptococcus lutetiensis]VEB80039.1 Uncharacterised protein [Streptococcus lutetiensis]